MTIEAPTTPTATGSVIFRRDELLCALESADSIVASRNHRAVMGCFWLHSQDDKVNVETRGADFSAIRIELSQVQVEMPMDVYVNCDNFLKVVRATSGETISIKVTADEVRVVSGDAMFKIRPLADGVFPPMPAISGKGVVVPAVELLRMIRQTAFAIDDTKSRYCTQCVRFTIEKKRISLATTNTNHIAESSCDVLFGDKLAANVSPMCATAIPKLIDSESGDVTIDITETSAVFSIAGVVLACPIIEGEFPTYHDFIPKDNTGELTVGSADMLDSATRASVVADLDPKLVMIFDEKHGVQFAMNSQNGESELNLAAKFRGPTAKFAVRSKYFLAGVGAVESAEMKLSCTDGRKPVVVTAGGNYLYMVQPINVEK